MRVVSEFSNSFFLFITKVLNSAAQKEWSTYDTIDDDGINPLSSKCVLIFEVVWDLLCGSLENRERWKHEKEYTNVSDDDPS
mmetsp:Transcript_10345/g.18907  ORF Transcript_10345/g.18907 Transcript_10345/m.18907 type:complete len:82 (+) Transcript_10345:182-427(+)